MGRTPRLRHSPLLGHELVKDKGHFSSPTPTQLRVIERTVQAFHQDAWAPDNSQAVPSLIGVGAASAAARCMPSALLAPLIKAIRLSDPSSSNISLEMDFQAAHIGVHG